MIKFLLSIFLIQFGCTPLFALISEQDKAQISSERQLLVNPGYEAGNAGWEATGASTLSFDSVSPLSGKKSAFWDATASGEYLRSPLMSLESGMKGKTCVAELHYLWDSGAAAQLEFQVLDEADAVVATQELSATTSGESKRLPLFFSCPDPATKQVRWALKGLADASIIKVDDTFLGSDRRLTFAVPKNEVETNILNSSITSDTTDIADLRFTGLEIGKVYELTFQASALSSDDYVQLAAYHGGVLIAQTYDKTVSAGAGDRTVNTASAKFTATDTTVTFSAFMGAGKTLEGNGTLNQTWAQLEKRNDLGGNFQEGLTLETTGFLVQSQWLPSSDLNLGTGTLTYSSDVTAPNVTLIDHLSEALVPCSNAVAESSTCSGSNEVLGIAFDAPTADFYEICMNATYAAEVGASGDVDISFLWHKIVNGTNTIELAGKVPMSIRKATSSSAGFDQKANPIQLCEVFSADAGRNTFHVRRSQGTSGTVTVNALRDDAIYFTVRKMSEQFPTPVFTDLQNSLNQKVSANGDEDIKVASVFIANPSGTPLLQEHYGNWVDSVTDSAVGQYQINLLPGAFESGAGPICTCTTRSVGRYCINGSAPNHSAIVVYVRTDAGAASDTDVHVTCVGK